MDVEIRPLTKDINILEDVVSQKATYATGRSSVLIHQSEEPNLVILDAIFNHSASVIITTNPAITHPYDLKNKRVMVTLDQAMASSFYAMLASQGVEKNSFTLQKHSFNLDDLVNGNTDAMSCYISNEPFLLKSKGVNFTLLNPRDYGYDFYDDLLFTSQKELQEHPERARRFVEASRKGWREAFEDVQATADLIFQKYNQQHKSLKNLVYEGDALKSIWCDDPKEGPILDYKRFDTMLDFYLFNHLIKKKPDLMKLLDPLSFNRKTITLGILAKQGFQTALEEWSPLINHINFELSRYNLIIKPLTFEEIEVAVKEKSIDFVLTNSMQYIQLEAKYGISRMATLINDNTPTRITDYGAVIFTRADNNSLNNLADIKHKRFGAVNPNSFGGWIMAKKLLVENGVKDSGFKSLEFLQTHDGVIKAVMSKEVDVGTVRTGALEKLIQTGNINPQDIKILHPLYYNNFPYMVSTELYPEWSFAKLKATPNNISNAILSDLLDPLHYKTLMLPSWSVPISYKSIRDLLKTLNMEPYKTTPVTYMVIFKEYYLVILSILIFILTLLLFNRYLHLTVKKRTQQLLLANERLKTLAETDELTGIANRRQFVKLAQRYFSIAKRNNNPLSLLALDIDWFKKINDTYGHDTGDEVLKLFTKTITKTLRSSDVFGRIGGEEFSILLQNTDKHHALHLAEKIRKAIERTPYTCDKNGDIYFTVSIGLSTFSPHDESLSVLLKNADNALYKAKDRGRNRVELI